MQGCIICFCLQFWENFTIAPVKTLGRIFYNALAGGLDLGIL